MLFHRADYFKILTTFLQALALPDTEPYQESGFET